MLIVMLRTVILFLLVITVMRLMGKRQIGQLQPYELAVLIMISALAAIPMEDIGIPLTNSIVPILILFAIQIFFSYASQKSERIRAFLDGRPSVLIRNGQIVEKELRNQRININDLLEQLRLCGYHDLAAVEFAVLETDGRLSVLPKSQHRPVQPRDLGIETAYEGLPHPLIIDGNINYDNLCKVKLDELWLKNELARRGLTEISEVFYAALDTEGNLYCQGKERAEDKK